MTKGAITKQVSLPNGSLKVHSLRLSSPIANMINDKKQSGKKRSRGDTTAGSDDVTKTNKSSSHLEEQQQHQWSKSKKKRMRLRSIKEKHQSTEDTNDKHIKESKQLTTKASKAKKTTPTSQLPTPTTTSTQKEDEGRSQKNSTLGNIGSSISSSSSALQRAFQERLSGSRFRILNEELYTSTSATAFQRFQQNPRLFDEYHEGFRHQVEQWPINPVTIIVKQLTNVYETSTTRRNDDKSQTKTKKNKSIVVADFGCGEAELAKQLLMIQDKNDNRHSNNPPIFVVHSFDLVAKGPNAELITACDAAHTPLPAGTVDYGVFCLALMGTNLADFIREGHRVLKPDGKLLIVEVRSRFESTTSTTPASNGETKKIAAKKQSDTKNTTNEDTPSTLQEFVQVLDQLGFHTYHTDRTNKMFVLINLKKNGKKPRRDLTYTAKPCIYKRR